MNVQNALFQVNPVLIARKCGGWLAITPKGWPLGIGVVGTTEAEAEERFASEMTRLSLVKPKALVDADAV